jgi:hypothetical protein
MKTDTTLRIEDVEEAHIAPYAALSRSVYGDAAISDPVHLRWKFLANPQGPSRGIHLYRDGALVARLVAQPRVFQSAAGSAKAAYMVDLVVHPEHRGMASLLALLGNIRHLSADFELVVVTPNDAGMQIWENFVKLPARFDLGVYVVPFRPMRAAARTVAGSVPIGFAALAADALWRELLRSAGALQRSGSLQLEFAWPGEAELAELLSVTASDPTTAGVRDAAFIDWRFRQSPVFRYEVAFVRKHERLTGYVATRRTVYGGYDTRFVVDAFGPQLTRADWSAVRWKLARRELARGGAELLMVLGNTRCGALASLARFPFVAVPASRLPQPTTLFAAWSGPPRFNFAPESFAVTLADCDMI